MPTSVGSDGQHRAANHHELVTVDINGYPMDIEFSELYATLGLRTAAAQEAFRKEFVGAIMGKPPGVLLGKLRRRRPDMVALLETIPIR